MELTGHYITIRHNHIIVYNANTKLSFAHIQTNWAVISKIHSIKGEEGGGRTPHSLYVIAIIHLYREIEIETFQFINSLVETIYNKTKLSLGNILSGGTTRQAAAAAQINYRLLCNVCRRWRYYKYLTTGGKPFLNYVSIYTLLHFVGFLVWKELLSSLLKDYLVWKRIFIVFPYERITRIKYLTPNLTWCTASVLSPIWVNSSLDYTVMPTGCSVHHWPLHNTTRPNWSTDATEIYHNSNTIH